MYVEPIPIPWSFGRQPKTGHLRSTYGQSCNLLGLGSVHSFSSVTNRNLELLEDIDTSSDNSLLDDPLFDEFGEMNA